MSVHIACIDKKCHSNFVPAEIMTDKPNCSNRSQQLPIEWEDLVIKYAMYIYEVITAVVACRLVLMHVSQ